MGKQKVQIRRRNWDVDCILDVTTRRGFYITEPPDVTLDGEKKKSLYGPQSPLYGTDYSDEQAFSERFRCECGEIQGKVFEGETCPVCGKKITFKDTDVNFCGWIVLPNGHKIVAPHYYNILTNIIGKKEFPDIIQVKQKVDRDGKRSDVALEDLENVEITSPFMGIGELGFRSRFVEIMEYYRKKKKNKSSSIDLLLKEQLSVFTSSIPIYTTAIRPQSVTSDTYYFTSIDKQINPLISLRGDLYNCMDIEVPLLLNRIQTRVNAIWDFNFELLNSKEGLIRDQLLGGALNLTSRNVIVPDPSLHDNEVDISYHTAHGLFKFKIIHYLMKLNDMSLADAHRIWLMGKVDFSEQIYQVMKFIVDHDKPKMLINRNPTLNYYSMILMGVRNIKRSKNDFTLAVPLSILPGLNADQLQGREAQQCVLKALCERLTRGVSYYKIAC